MDAEERNDGRWRRSAHRGGEIQLAAISPRHSRSRRETPACAVPQAAVLLAPITDFFFEQYESFEQLAPLGIVYDTAFIGFIRGAYLVHGRNWGHPHASPTRADLHGYPATFIATGTADPLVDDNRAFAESCARRVERKWSISSAMGCRTVSISFPECSRRATKLSRRSRHFSSAQVWLDGSPFAPDFRSLRAVDHVGCGLHSRCVPTI